MPIYLGSTEISTLYLGAAGYATPNVDAVYLGTTLVWSASPTVTFSQGTDAICTGNASYIGIDGSLTGDFRLYVTYTTSDFSNGTIVWEGSSDNGQTWSAISSFLGYNSESGGDLFMDRISSYDGYRIRAKVNGIPTTIFDVADGGYYDYPPCEP